MKERYADVFEDTEGRRMPRTPAMSESGTQVSDTVRSALGGQVLHVTGRNPKDIAGDAKPPLHLVPSAFTHPVAEVLRYGAAKYGEWNWRQKAPAMSAYRSACQRHLDAWFGGEDIDPGSGLPHLAHAASTLAVIMDAIANGSVVDDRPPRVASRDTSPEPVAETEFARHATDAQIAHSDPDDPYATRTEAEHFARVVSQTGG